MEPSQAVLELLFGRWRSQILYAGVKLGVFDVLAKEASRQVGVVEAAKAEITQ